MTAKLYAIGLGPGDPELLTIKGQRLLGEVDVVFVPKRDERDSLSGQIVARWADPSKVRELPFRMSKRREENVDRWRQHADTLAASVKAGQSAAIVTEGDPLLYSTFVHVYGELLRAHPDVPVEIVPGVSSATAGAAAAAIPLVDGDERLGVVPATGEVMHALATFDSVVILKISAALETVLKALKVTGRMAQATYVERAGWPEQRVVHAVESLRKEKKLDYFGQIIVVRR